MRVSSAAIAAVTVALLLPAGAAATVRKVAPSGSDSSNCAVSVCKTIQYATDQAANGDTVEIAAGTYEETVETSTTLEWVGAGSGATIVLGLAGTIMEGKPAFYLKGGGTLKSLKAEGGEGGVLSIPPVTIGQDGGPAIQFEPGGLGQDELKIEDVDALGGDVGTGTLPDGSGAPALLAEASEGGKSVTAVDLVGRSGAGGLFGTAPAAEVLGNAMSARLIESDLESGAAGLSFGFRVAEGASATLESTEVSAEGYGAGAEGGFLTVRRSSISGTLGGLIVTASNQPAGEARVIDSLITSPGIAARVASVVGTGTPKLLLDGSTVYAEGGPQPAVEAESPTPEVSVTASLRNTIAFNEPNGEPQRDLVANGGTITAQSSNFSASFQENGGTAPAPGSGTNVAGPPGFAGTSFFLAPGSPLIDRGDPSIVQTGELDLEGSPRSLDGNHDCIAAPDIGAIEATGQSSTCKVADAVPVVSGFKISNKRFAPKGSSKPHAKTSKKRPKKGTKFSYSLSEPAKVAIVIERKKKPRRRKFVKVTTLSAQQKSGNQSLPFSGKVGGKPLKPGKYRATITATDSAGQTSQPHQLSFQVVTG
jgi:hypothetical protein